MSLTMVGRVRAWIMLRAAMWRVNRYQRAIAAGRLSCDEADRRLKRDLRLLSRTIGKPADVPECVHDG